MSLETRDGLPEALRVLLAEYPREGWAADPGFSGLVAFWLERHMMFRQLSERLDDGAAEVADADGDARGYARALARLGGLLVNQLHGHHQIEDLHYFPKLTTKDPRLEAGFALLDADHHALDGHIGTFVTAANAGLQGLQGDDPVTAAAEVRRSVVGFRRLLERHLTDEEDLIVPVILKHGSADLG